MASEEPSTTPIDLSPAILRGLGDRSYDKRKNAALEVTTLVKNLLDHGEHDRIANIITLLSDEFVRSKNSNHRKGGLIGLAAASIGIMPEISKYLNMLIPPILECFDDPESRVCYYACEALYNVSKIARNHILSYFNQVFEGLCKLFAHTDVDVKNGANLLDRLIKDIVTETETFEIETFIPLLQKHIKRTKPYIRQLLVGWIIVLDAVPDINMLDYLPDFLDGLFNMLSDPNREIRQAADNALGEFLREIKLAEVVEFGSMVNILVSQSHSKERFARFTSIVWLSEFILLGGTRLLMQYSSILGSVMSCISDTEVEIRAAANEANNHLLHLVRTTSTDFDLKPLLTTLTNELFSAHVSTRVASLQWIYMLHERNSTDVNAYIDELLPTLLKTLSDQADDVVLATLQVLARICLDEQQFRHVFLSLVALFLDNRQLLEARGALIIRKLCTLLDGRQIYLQLASILSDQKDLDFTSLFVQTLNLILLTAPELQLLRKSLKRCFMETTQDSNNDIRISNNNNNSNLNNNSTSSNETDNEINDLLTLKEDKQTFQELFRCWSHNPVATFSLCLLAQTYELSAKLIEAFVEVEVSVGFLMQIDKLVQLIESPIFIHLRLQLLRSDLPFHAPLLQSLYGLLMLLPQSQAYKTLSDRLTTVSSLQLHLSGVSRPLTSSRQSVTSTGDKEVMDDGLDHQALLKFFIEVQRRHSDFKLTILHQKRLQQNHSPQSTPTSQAQEAPSPPPPPPTAIQAPSSSVITGALEAQIAGDLLSLSHDF